MEWFKDKGGIFAAAIFFLGLMNFQYVVFKNMVDAKIESVNVKITHLEKEVRTDIKDVREDLKEIKSLIAKNQSSKATRNPDTASNGR